MCIRQEWGFSIVNLGVSSYTLFYNLMNFYILMYTYLFFNLSFVGHPTADVFLSWGLVRHSFIRSMQVVDFMSLYVFMLPFWGFEGYRLCVTFTINVWKYPHNRESVGRQN